MDHIVLTTDFSEESKRAFTPAKELATRLGLGIHLIHVVEDLKLPAQGAPLAPPQSAPDIGQAIEESDAKLKEMATDLHSPGREVTAQTVTNEDIAGGIVEHAEQSGAAYIVMSTHGRSGIRHWILGSVAEGVLRRATIPVICYPPSR